MKTELKVKFLQYLNQKQPFQGFTFIQLVVVIIIIGILAAVALNSFLPQSKEATCSGYESKTYIGSINMGQQVYFSEKGRFGTDISSLGIGIKTQTINWTYSTTVSGSGTNQIAYSYSSLHGHDSTIKNYAGLVSLTHDGATSDVTSVTILCETIKPGDPAIKPINVTTCASGSTEVVR